jgi:uncharacterized protein DUF4412
MRLVGFSFLFLFSASLPLRADLTIVQKVEGGGANNEMTMKLKGDKMRIEISPQLTTIIDAKTGEMINLMNDQKKVMRMSGEKVKAAMEMARQFSDKNGKKAADEKPKLASTGKKETINGFETEQYTYETPEFKAAYWIAPKYPNGAAILKQLQSIKPDVWKTSHTQMPDYRDFPGLPIKTVLSMAGNQITTTLIAVKEDPLSDAEFTVPKDYQEMKLPDMSSLLQQSPMPATTASPKS